MKFRMRATSTAPVCQVTKDGEEICDTLGDEFFSFLTKNMDGEGIWDTLEDALR